MRYRVDELAIRGGVSVDTVRFYQGKGLLEAPVREGRIAWYSDAHLHALRRILELKDKGFSLASIRRLLTGDLDPADRALVAALAEPPPGDDEGEGWLTLDELAARTGVSPAILGAIEREGLLVPQLRDGRAAYTPADAAAVSAGLELLGAGLPLSQLLALAREHGRAMRSIAERAVDLFDEFVRRPLLSSANDDADAADRLVAAFRAMFPATTALVAHNFGRVLLEVARERLEGEGSEAEIAALQGGAEGPWPGA
jgi:DNA-binding transcriptional MerR regulator